MHTLLSNKNLAGIPYPLSFGQGLYELHTSQCAHNSMKELEEYHLGFHTSWPWMDPYGHIRKALGPKYSHLHSGEDFWANCKDENEVQMRHYMRMTAYFVKRLNLFPVPNQVEEDESTIIDPQYGVDANLLLPSID